ncbi:MAG: hypothetical protein GYA51_09755 [Candidatus Methanofastidiosa archaeon]|nr:hypothetical protein [Candidatus Methanofastidiosa archaeon]
MINNDSLGDRLNAVKRGKPLPPPPQQQTFMPPQTMPTQQSQPSSQSQYSVKFYFLSKLFVLFDSGLASLLYGIALKTIFNLDWSLFEAFSVGFLLNHAVSIFPRVLFPKLFK